MIGWIEDGIPSPPFLAEKNDGAILPVRFGRGDEGIFPLDVGWIGSTQLTFCFALPPGEFLQEVPKKDASLPEGTVPGVGAFPSQ